MCARECGKKFCYENDEKNILLMIRNQIMAQAVPDGGDVNLFQLLAPIFHSPMNLRWEDLTSFNLIFLSFFFATIMIV